MPSSRSSHCLFRLALGATLAAFAPSAAPAQPMPDYPSVHVGVGWSVLHIDDVEFTAITDFLVTEVQDHQSNHDGEMNGYRINAGVDGLLQHQRGSWLASVGLAGFYSRYEDAQDTRCVVTSTTDCAFFPLVDPDTETESLGDISGGFFSDWRTEVDRKVVHWGAAVELSLTPFSAPAGGSLKDAPAPVQQAAFAWRAGLAFRRLDQDVSLFSVDVGPTADPVTLDDDLNTDYYGGYFGFSTWKPLGHAFRLKLSGETGLYYAHTDYQGDYTASAALGDDLPRAASVSLTDTAPAFIGLLSLSVERDLGAATLAFFGETEWISYVPKVLYNDTDRNGGPPFDIIGSQDGTELGEGSALTYTLGARLSVPVQ